MKYLFVSLDGLIADIASDRWFEEDSDRLHSWGYLTE